MEQTETRAPEVNIPQDVCYVRTREGRVLERVRYSTGNVVERMRFPGDLEPVPGAKTSAAGETPMRLIKATIAAQSR